MKMARIDDKVYEVIVANAAKDGRTIFSYMNRLLSQALVDYAEPVVSSTSAELTFKDQVTLKPASALRPAKQLKLCEHGYAICKFDKCKARGFNRV
jgi:hypothetical protein